MESISAWDTTLTETYFPHTIRWIDRKWYIDVLKRLGKLKVNKVEIQWYKLFEFIYWEGPQIHNMVKEYKEWLDEFNKWLDSRYIFPQ
jgi:hypothetical protein